jgi:type II secretory pathway pseudopilin PulG
LTWPEVLLAIVVLGVLWALAMPPIGIGLVKGEMTQTSTT